MNKKRKIYKNCSWCLSKVFVIYCFSYYRISIYLILCWFCLGKIKNSLVFTKYISQSLIFPISLSFALRTFQILLLKKKYSKLASIFLKHFFSSILRKTISGFLICAYTMHAYQSFKFRKLRLNIIQIIENNTISFETTTYSDIFKVSSRVLIVQRTNESIRVIHHVATFNLSRGTTVSHSKLFPPCSFLAFLNLQKQPNLAELSRKSSSNTLKHRFYANRIGNHEEMRRCFAHGSTTPARAREFASIENEMPFSNIGNIGQGMKQKS